MFVGITRTNQITDTEAFSHCMYKMMSLYPMESLAKSQQAEYRLFLIVFDSKTEGKLTKLVPSKERPALSYHKLFKKASRVFGSVWELEFKITSLKSCKIKQSGLTDVELASVIMNNINLVLPLH